MIVGRPKLLVADLLCGAGGSSTGAKHALDRLGYEMDLVCVNHWPVAIDTHSLNHPKARHYCQDIASVRPHVVVPEGYLDLMMASPSCTHHSVARGGKPTSDQQRSDPWHILTWLSELDVFNMMVENVWEYTKWGPVDVVTRRPIKEKEGQYFEMWTDNIRKFDFEPQWRKLNTADYGSATTRKRFIMLAKKKRRSITWPIITHGKGAAKPWRPARDIIDWSIKGRSIFGRPVPLAPKTLARILAGVIKFCWPPIFAVMLRAELNRSLRHTIRYNFDRRHADKIEVRRRSRLRALAYVKWLRAFRGAAAEPEIGLRAASPMLVVLRNHADGRHLDLPIPALAAGGTHIALAEPIILANRNNNAAKEVSGSPAPCFTTAPGGGIVLIEPLILATGQAPAREATDPLPGFTTGGADNEERPGCARPMLIEPFVLSQASGGAPRATSEPLPTAVGGGAVALVAPYFSSGSGETCTTVDTPLPTVTARDRFGLVVPITHSDTSNRARDVDVDPLPTLTTAHRGELALIESVNLVEATGHDILFRMFEAHELAAAMGFSRDLVKYEFTGNKTEQVKQIGNAVPVELADACVTALFLGEGAPPQLMEAAE